MGLTLSGLLKYGVATVVGRDVVARRLPARWRAVGSIGERRSTAGGLALVCAYPFGPKHVFQLAAILSGMTLGKFALAVGAGAKFRAGAFAFLGDAVATGQGIVAVSALLLGVAAAPLCVPRWRRRLLTSPESAA